MKTLPAAVLAELGAANPPTTEAKDKPSKGS